MDRVQVAENRAVASHGVVDVLHTRPLTWRRRLGYFSVAAPVMADCAGLLNDPWAAGFAYPVLLLGIGSIWRGMLAPRPVECVQAEQGRAVVGDGHEVVIPEAAMAWCGYVLMSASVLGSSFGLADTPAAAIGAYALLLLGFAIVSISMLPLRPMELFLREESRSVRNGNHQGDEDEVLVPRPARGMDWTGYFFVAAPVLATCAGRVEGPAATFFAFALLLLGVAFIIIAMRALAKHKMA